MSKSVAIDFWVRDTGNGKRDSVLLTSASRFPFSDSLVFNNQITLINQVFDLIDFKDGPQRTQTPASI